MIRITLLGLIAAFGLSACNTMDGAGKDVSAAGDTISNTAESTEELVEGSM